MVSKDFNVGDLVWAKMKGFPPWPAKISRPEKPPHAKKAYHYVYFFGSKNYAWILDEKIVPHDDAFTTATNKKRQPDLQAAIDEIIAASKEVKLSAEKIEENENRVLLEVLTKSKPTLSPKKLEEHKKMKQSSGKIPKKRLFSSTAFKSKHSSKVRKLDDSHVAVIRPFDDDICDLDSRCENGSRLPLNQNETAVGIKIKHVQPTSKKIGFMGLGMMGRGIVTNLLKSGHDVTVWNKTADKCDFFLKVGALKAKTPAEVVQACDIIFACVSDPDASKSLVFGNDGVLQGLEKSSGGIKGYVEMTSIDGETSQEIAEAVSLKGGKYLEAPITGSSHLAEEGSLLILTSGDKGLFEDCKTCFHAMSKHAYYIGPDVGEGANYSLITSMLMGTACAALAEAMALADRIKVSQTDFLEILQLKGLTSPLFFGKGKAILDRQFTAVTSLKHQQKDLNLALQLSHVSEQPMPVTTAANELYKHARLLGYSDSDAASVYFGAKF